ncbi:MAG TPA: lyase family protein, partial [Pyrinomonadaceae bacterium]|nr:lyase family protein [Pyrinomonadaceae bacterium]
MAETKQVSDKNFLRQFQSSFSLDRRLFAAAVRADAAYCDTLFHAGILTRQEAERIKSGLSTLLKRADYDRNYFAQIEAENVHSFIEGRLVQLVGEIAAKLKLGRTAEEQTLTALRIWLREKNVEVSLLLQELQKEILNLAENGSENFFTDNGKEIYFAEWCIGYFEIWQQDRERLDEVWRRINVFSRLAEEDGEQNEEIDYEEFSRQLKFEGIFEGNSSFAFDFALEFINASTILMLHQASLAEDL